MALEWRSICGTRSRCLILAAGLLILLSVELGGVGVSHGFWIGAQVTTDFGIVPVTPQNPFGFTFVDDVSCFPRISCGSATSRYAVLGTSRETISAQFGYGYSGDHPSHSIFFQATDLKGQLLVRVRAARAFGDEFDVEATSCGPQPGSCVSFTDTTTGGALLPVNVPLFPNVSREEFESRAAGGVVTIGTGLVPFYLPVGPGASISARVDISAGIFFDLCRSAPSECHAETSAGFTLIALPPPGASFIEPVPEPTTLLLIGTTAVGLGLARWRQRRRKQPG